MIPRQSLRRASRGLGLRGVKPVSGLQTLSLVASSLHGQTDELGSAAVENRFHVKNLHATMLTQLGFDPNGLSYFYGGLHQKLVGVERAEPIRQII